MFAGGGGGGAGADSGRPRDARRRFHLERDERRWQARTDAALIVFCPVFLTRVPFVDRTKE